MPGCINGVRFLDEDFVDLKDYFGDQIVVSPQCYYPEILDSVNICRVRKTVAEKLAIAMNALPDDLTFMVYDAWRPLSVQQYLFDQYYARCKAAHSDLSDEKLMKEVTQFVSVPSYDAEMPAVFTSGCAIALTLYHTRLNKELNMGTGFNSFCEQAVTDYYETNGEADVRRNRRILYVAMLNAGFTNFPAAWWHYDYGDAFWSYYTGKCMLYKGVF